MLPKRPRALVCLALAHAWGLSACSDSQYAGLGAPEAGPNADGRANQDAGGSLVFGTGGAGASSGGGEGGTGQPDSGGGNTGSGGDGGSIDPGSGGSSNALSLCVRLDSPTVLSFDLTRAYDHKVYADCRVKWVTDLYLRVDSRDAFLNNLLAWNMQFWGCTPPAPTDFALIYAPTALTSADAAALINDYIDAASVALAMSAPEIAGMRAALQRLSQSVVVRTSDEFSNPSCSDAGAGGSGGVAGAGGGAGAVSDAARAGDVDASPVEDAGAAGGASGGDR
jgi:hypothetical protein